MHPVLIDLPILGLSVRSYQAMLLLSVLMCIALGPLAVEGLEGLDRRRTRRALLTLGVVTLLGARLHFVMNHWPLFADRPLGALQLWSGGLHAGGGILLLAASAPFVVRLYGLPLGKFADGLVPVVGAGTAIARLGCLFQGCCFGRVCDLRWCLRFPPSAFVYHQHAFERLLPPGASLSRPVHPLQIYFLVAALALAVVGVGLRHRKRYEGQVALVGFLWFSATSAVLERFRADSYPRAYWGSLPQLEWTALAMTGLAGLLLVAAELAQARRRHLLRASPSLQRS